MPLSDKAAAAKDKRTGIADMQHRHFATVAAILADFHTNNTAFHQAMIKHFADSLRHTNSNFNRARFVAACQPEA